MGEAGALQSAAPAAPRRRPAVTPLACRARARLAAGGCPKCQSRCRGVWSQRPSTGQKKTRVGVNGVGAAARRPRQTKADQR